MANSAVNSTAAADPVVRRSDTRDRLLEEAITLFSERGFEATTMRDLAASVGVKAPAIYNHFDSKEEILATAIAWALDQFRAYVVVPDDPTAAPETRLQDVSRRHVLFQLHNRQLAGGADTLLRVHVADRYLSDEDARELRRTLREYLDLVMGLVARYHGRSSPSPEDHVTAFAITSMCDQVPTWYRPDGPLSPEEVADQLSAHAMAMLEHGPA